MFLIKGWTQTCVQNLIKIPPAQSPKTISTAWPLAWPRTVGALADHRPEDPTCLKCLSVQKRNPTSPSLDRTQPAESRAQHLIFAPYEVSIKTGRARLQLMLMAIFFPTSIWFNIFPSAHPDWWWGGIWGNGRGCWGSCRENFNRCINCCKTGPAYLDHFPPGSWWAPATQSEGPAWGISVIITGA